MNYNIKGRYWFLKLMSFAVAMQFGFYLGIYFIFPFALSVLSFFIILFFSDFSAKRLALLGLSFILLFILVFVDHYQTALSIRRLLVYYGFIIIFIFVISEILPKVDYFDLMKIIRATIIFCTLAVCVEAFLRFRFPTLALNFESTGFEPKLSLSMFTISELFTGTSFYTFKYSSVMFYDSNYVGVFSLFTVVLALFYKDYAENKRSPWLLIIVNSLLVYLSFSRSAIITLSLVFYAYVLREIYRINRSLFVFSLIPIIVIILYVLMYVANVIIDDGSFLTKISIFYALVSMLEQDLINILFGFGLLHGGYVYSYEEGAYAHALVPLLLGQIGVFGLIFYLLTVIYLAFKSGFYGFLLLFVFLFSGLSLADPFQALMFYIFMLMGALLKRHSQARLVDLPS